jgi:hypothetical protein
MDGSRPRRNYAMTLTIIASGIECIVDSRYVSNEPEVTRSSLGLERVVYRSQEATMSTNTASQFVQPSIGDQGDSRTVQ